MRVMLDLDGTLTDPKVGIVSSLTYAMQCLGRPAPDTADLTRYIGPPLRDVLAELLDSRDDTLIEQGVAAYRERYNEVGFLQNRPYPNVHEVLAGLKRHFESLLVVTSKPTPIARRVIEHFELMPYFDRVFGSGMNGEIADKRKLIAHVLDEEAITSRDVVMVGDRKHDVIGAAFNSVPAVGVLWGYGTAAELTAAGAQQLCKRPTDLKDSIQVLAGVL